MTSQNAGLPLIELRSIVKRFGRVTALDRVDLSVAAGESLTIFGPNGAGKTTLLRMIAGLVKPTSGGLVIAGEDVTRGHHDQLRRRIGYISHQSLVYAELTAAENLVFFARLYGVADARGKADALLAEVGLSSRAGDTVGTFSRGMRQRLSIARAMINDPDMILLDEPFTGLDQHAASMLQNILKRLHGENRTIIMITHNLRAGLEMGTRIVIQTAGRISFDKPAGEIDHAAFAGVYNGIVGNAHY